MGKMNSDLRHNELQIEKERILSPDPCVIVIFGASGDLTSRKLMPALYGLYLEGGLHSRFAVLGAARTPYSQEAFREKIGRAVGETGLPMDRWGDFVGHVHYLRMDYDDEGSLFLSGRFPRASGGHRHASGRQLARKAVTFVEKAGGR